MAKHDNVWFVIAPYVLSKVVIAMNVAFLQNLFGRIGGPALSSESAALGFQFLIFGAAMGGMRGISILAATAAAASVCDRAPEEDEEEEDVVDVADTSCCRFLFWGRIDAASARSDGYALRSRLRSIFSVSFLSTTIFCVPATLLFVYATEFVQLFAPRMSPDVVRALSDYARNFAWGVAPTLWLYCIEQFLLGIHAAGAAFVCGAAYAAGSSALCWALYSTGQGAAGLGLGMSVGAWVVFAVVALVCMLEPKYRELCSLAAVYRTVFASFCDDGEDPQLVIIHRLGPLLFEYLHLATPLALSNVVGLLVSLVIAAAVDDDDSQQQSSDSTRQQQVFSIASSYYSSLMIAVLGSSSAVSAVVAFSSRAATRAAIRCTVFVSLGGIVCAVLPFFDVRAFSLFFGSSISSNAEADTVKSFAESELRSFLVPCCLSFCVGTLAMCVSASLHGRQDVTAPLLFHIAVYTLGATWVIVARNSFDSVIAAAYGTVLGPALYLLALIWRWRTLHAVVVE